MAESYIRHMSDAAPVTEEDLRGLVALFYERVRADKELGPIFNQAITDWPVHLTKIVDFWSSIMLSTQRYRGNPMAKHLLHRDLIQPEHFDRWLDLWRLTTDELLAPAVAEELQDRAQRVGKSLKMALFFRPDR